MNLTLVEEFSLKEQEDIKKVNQLWRKFSIRFLILLLIYILGVLFRSPFAEIAELKIFSTLFWLVGMIGEIIILGHYAYHISGEKSEAYFLVGLLGIWSPGIALIGYFVVMFIKRERIKEYKDNHKLIQHMASNLQKK